MKKLQKGLFILMLGLTFTACGNTTSSLESTGSSNQVTLMFQKISKFILVTPIVEQEMVSLLELV